MSKSKKKLPPILLFAKTSFKLKSSKSKI